MTFVGREAELNYLTQHYENKTSQILVVYGQKGVGKTTLLRRFVQNKDSAYYIGRACSDREQRYQWAKELSDSQTGAEEEHFPEYEEILDKMTGTLPENAQKVIILDEFHHLVKGNPLFFHALLQYVQKKKGTLLVILCSSASGWVENNMVAKLGSDAATISGFLKVKEFSLNQMQELFPAWGKDDCIQLYAVLGGVPGLWKRLDEALSARDNMIKNIINPYSAVHGEMTCCLLEDLRETAVYNTILSTMAGGNYKLNDIYHQTEFSRAKISVYLKNLMEIDMVEKVGAGTYRISRPYIRFYFRFIYSEQSLLEELTPEQFFVELVEDAFPGFVREAYRKS